MKLTKNQSFLTLLIPISLLIWWPVIKATQFIYDDYHFLLLNESVYQLKNISSVLQYNFQPTKPVFNFFMAFIHWIGKGTITAHHWANVLLHIANSILFYLVALVTLKRFGKEIPVAYLFCTVLLFAIHPIHSETMAIIQFRGDVLGTFFTLLALLFVNQFAISSKNYFLPLTLLCILLAQFCKEMFAFTGPILVLAAYWLPPDKNKKGTVRLFFSVAAIELVCLAIFKYLVARDKEVEYNYSHVVGIGVMSLKWQAILASRTLLEGLYKLASGLDLTTVRLNFRNGVGAYWNPAYHYLVLSLAFCLSVGIVLKRNLYTLTYLFFFIPIFFYLAVPNLNIGAEHYWYFSSLGFFLILMLALSDFQKKYQLPQLVLWGGFGIITASLIVNQQIRTRELQNRLTYTKSEWVSHPEHAGTWIDFASSFFDIPELKKKIPEFIEGARRIKPGYGAADRLELNYLINSEKRDWKKIRVAFERSTLSNPDPHSRKSLVSTAISNGLRNVLEKRCDEAVYWLDQGLSFQKDNLKMIKFVEKYKSEVAKIQRLQKCASETDAIVSSN